MRRMMGVPVSMLLFACADTGGGGDVGSGGSSTTTGDASSGSEGGSTGGSSGGSSGGAADSSGGTTTGGLPDYTDSPCYGMPASTQVYDGQTHQISSVSGTCRAEGERTFVIVADDLWEQGIDQSDVAGFMHRYELFTPAGSIDPDQGVIVNDEAVFGSLDAAGLPGGKVAIFVVDTNGGGDGYLCSWCDYPQLHLDGTVLTPLDGDDALSIAAHESYHIIHRGYDADEVAWIDESMAEAAMSANGFFTDDEWLDDFRLDPDQDWGPGGVDFGTFNYGAGLLWGTYLYERGGAPLMTAITAEATNDWAGLDAALASVGDDDAFTVFLDMGVAMIADRPELGYGFESFDVGEVAREGDLVAGDGATGAVYPGGFDVYRLIGPGPLTITATGAGIGARAFTITDSITVVDPVGGASLEVGAQDDAFVFVTAAAGGMYTLDVQ